MRGNFEGVPVLGPLWLQSQDGVNNINTTAVQGRISSVNDMQNLPGKHERELAIRIQLIINRVPSLTLHYRRR